MLTRYANKFEVGFFMFSFFVFFYDNAYLPQ